MISPQSRLHSRQTTLEAGSAALTLAQSISVRALACTVAASVSPGRYRAPDPLVAFLENP
jgi:hypothetical protein